MTLSVIVYALLVGAVLSAAALVFEQAASWLRLGRRWIWFAAMVAVPVLTFSVPWRAIAAPSLAITTGGGSIETGRSGSGRSKNIEPVFRAVSEPLTGSSAEELNAVVFWSWVAMSGLALVHYAGGRFALALRRRHWARTVLQGHSVLVSTDAGPAIIGCWFTSIVVPAWALGLDAPSVSLLLAHEREHEAARDPLLVHLAQIAVVLMPWNPAMWWMGRRLRAAVEMDCDARVLAGRESPADRADYGELLITVAARIGDGPSRLSPALIERSSALRRRIAAMHATQPRALRTKCVVAALVTLGLIGTALTFPVPSVEAQGTSRTAPPASHSPAPLVAPRAMTSERDLVGANPVTPRGMTPLSAKDATREDIEVPNSSQTTPPTAPVVPPTPAPTDTAPGVTNDGDLAQVSGTATVPGTGRLLGAGVYRTESGIQFPVVVREVKPVYTSAAMREKIQGTVGLEIIIDEDGTVRDVRVVRSLDAIYGLDQEAIKAARQWLFRPALSLDNKPLPMIVLLELEFRLAHPDDGFGAGAYRMGSGITNPVVLRDQKPVYTSDAMRAKIQGVVQMEAVVDENGTVRDVRVTRSLDRVYGLDQEAMKAARLWLFRPARDRNGKPVPVIITLELEFRLDKPIP